MIPVTVITGFLGSGKTTLLARLMRDPAMGRTAVIINEFGAIGLDHDLVETSDESFVRLSNGCLCCNVRSDLTLTLGDLAVRRAQGTLPPFERVVIETSGLADPAPILHALMTDRDLAGTYALDGVVTTVDALLGLTTLDQHEESRRQAAVADRIVITKTDLDGAQTTAIRQRLSKVNPGAQVIEAVRGAIAPTALFDCGFYDVAGKTPDVSAWLAHEIPATDDTRVPNHPHTDNITSFSIVRSAPLHAVTLPLLLSALAENCGSDLLRMKGIVHVREDPQRPAVIHGVQHVYHAPVWLPRWPSADRRTRMIFIGRNLRVSWVRSLIELLDAEVAAETAKCAVMNGHQGAGVPATNVIAPSSAQSPDCRTPG
jgi:G3E family GTPase